jgi:predicted  nucleic acid-binding Zn-ribbon protein
MDAWQIIGTAVVVICGLVGVIYWSGQSRDDKQDTRAERNEKAFNEHVRDDMAAHERLRAVETEVATLKAEVKSLREKWHDLRSEVTHTLATWYTDIVGKIKK